MNKLRKATIGTILVGMLLVNFSCWNKSASFRAFTDSFAASWSLNLYADGTFDMHLAIQDFAGKYTIQQDTIIVPTYDLNTQGLAPQAYGIDRNSGSIFELNKTAGDNWIRSTPNRWMEITEDNLQ